MPYVLLGGAERGTPLITAMRELDASGADSVGGGEQKRAVPDDHPVLVAFRNARMVDEPVPEVERVAVEEWMASPEGVDGEVVAAMLAERAARESCNSRHVSAT